ncbi:MAG: hypothetical protein QM727_01705 [Niabella sp.]
MNINFDEQIALKSNDELIEIYTNSLDYQPEFAQLAEQEIIKRNIPLDAVRKIKDKNIEIEAQTLAIGKQGNPIYLTLIAIAAIGGGIISIIGGYIYAYSTHLDSKGEKYFVYNESTRKWGRIILWIGVAVLLLTILITTG